MKMFTRVLLVDMVCFMTVSLVALASYWLPTPSAVVNTHTTLTQNTPTPIDLPVYPLPGGCPGNLPPGSTSCLSGFVYLNGQAIVGAEVQMVSQSGKKATVFTKVSETEVDKHPHCTLSLQALGVQPGETITLTAYYSGHSQTIAHTVVAGDQQVDLVLPRRNTTDLLFKSYLGEQAKPNKFNQIYGMAFDPLGNFYVIDNANSRIQVFDSQGGLLRILGKSSEGLSYFRNPYGIAIDSQGDVYVTDYSDQRVHKLHSDGQLVLSWGSFGQEEGEFNEPADIDIDKKDSVYIVDYSNHRVQKFDSQGNFVTSWGSLGSELGQFNGPSGIAIDNQIADDPIIYVTDSRNNRVQKFDSNGNSPNTFIKDGVNNIALRNPLGIAVDINHNVYIVDTGNYRIQKFSKDGAFLTSWSTKSIDSKRYDAPREITIDFLSQIYVSEIQRDRIQRFDSNGTPLPLLNFDKSGENAKKFSAPQKIALDIIGNFFVVDHFNDRIQKFDRFGNFQHEWGSKGTITETLYGPRGIGVDTSGDVYVADTFNHRIQKFNNNGEFIIRWGKEGSGEGQFSFPGAVGVDLNNDIIYIVDSGNNRIQQFKTDGQFITMWGQGGIANKEFNNPTDIAISPDTIYVADSGNHRVQAFDINGNFLRSWSAQGIQAIAIDNSENIFVSNVTNHKIQQFDKLGKPLMEWGMPNSTNGAFSAPRGLVFDKDGYLLVADSVNDHILRAQVMTYTLPVATVKNISANARNLAATETLTATGMGQVSDTQRTIRGYRWNSNKDGELSDTDTLIKAASQLTVGTHIITFTVQDDLGEWSRPVEFPIFVRRQMPSTPTPSLTPSVSPTPTPPGYTPPPTPSVEPNVPTQWTLLLYFVCDYDDGQRLEQQCRRALDELKQTPLNPNVRIAVQLDGSRSLHGGEPDSERWLLRPGAIAAGSVMTQEQPMDDPSTLTNFILWGQKALPAAHYYLAIIDHGQAVQGIGWDDSTVGVTLNHLTPSEIANALRAEDVIPLDVLHLDGCSMALLEVAFELRQSAQYLIASQYLAWSYFAYRDYQQGVHTTTTPLELAQQIVQSYGKHAQPDHFPFTLSLLDLSQVERVNVAVHGLAKSLIGWLDVSNTPEEQQQKRLYLEEVRNKSQKFEYDNNFDHNPLDAYVDLRHWLSLLEQGGLDDNGTPLPGAAHYGRIKNAASVAASILDHFVVTQTIGSGVIPLKTLPDPLQERYKNDPNLHNGIFVDLDNANGISIFYPYSRNQLPGVKASAIADEPPTRFDESYMKYIADQTFVFTTASFWNEFLVAAIGELPAGQPVAPEPGPLAALQAMQRIFLPIIVH